MAVDLKKAARNGRRFTAAMLLTGGVIGAALAGPGGYRLAKNQAAREYQKQAASLQGKLDAMTGAQQYNNKKAILLQKDLDVVRNQAIRSLFPFDSKKRDEIIGIAKSHYGEEWKKQKGIEYYAEVHGVVEKLRQAGLQPFENEYKQIVDDANSREKQGVVVAPGVRVYETEGAQGLREDALKELKFVRRLAQSLGVGAKLQPKRPVQTPGQKFREQKNLQRGRLRR